MLYGLTAAAASDLFLHRMQSVPRRAVSITFACRNQPVLQGFQTTTPSTRMAVRPLAQTRERHSKQALLEFELFYLIIWSSVNERAADPGENAGVRG